MILTKTSILVKFIIKTLLLPIKVEENGKVVCKIFSMRTVLHFLIVVGPTAILFVALMLIVPELSMLSIDNENNKGLTTFEIFSNNFTFIISNLGIFFPIILGHGLKNLPSNSILKDIHNWPKEGWMNIIGNFPCFEDCDQNLFPALSFLMVGSFLSMYAFMPASLTMIKVIGSHIVTQGFVLFQSIPWIMPPLVAEILLQDFSRQCDSIINVTDQGNDILESYEKLERSFGWFFLAFYSWIQVFSIYNTYQLFILLGKGGSTFIAVFAAALLTLSLILIIVTLANSVSNSYNSVKSIKKRMQDELSYEGNKVI